MNTDGSKVKNVATQTDLERALTRLSYGGCALYALALLVYWAIGASVGGQSLYLELLFDLLGSQNLVRNRFGEGYADVLLFAKVLAIVLSVLLSLIAMRLTVRAEKGVKLVPDKDQRRFVHSAVIVVGLWMLQEPSSLCMGRYAECTAGVQTLRFLVPVVILGLFAGAAPTVAASILSDRIHARARR